MTFEHLQAYPAQPHLRDTVLVAQNNADRGRRQALLCKLRDILLNLQAMLSRVSYILKPQLFLTCRSGPTP